MIHVSGQVFSLLALLAVLFAGAVALAALARRTAALRAFFAGLELPVATAVAVTATGGSLFYSEVVGLTPCALCWVQRAFMFPLVALVPAVALAPRLLRPLVLTLTAGGAGVALWHTALERLPAAPSGPCAADVPCDVPVFEIFGFVSLPVMALAGFLAIGALTWLSGRPTTISSHHRDDRQGARS